MNNPENEHRGPVEVIAGLLVTIVLFAGLWFMSWISHDDTIIPEPVFDFRWCDKWGACSDNFYQICRPNGRVRECRLIHDDLGEIDCTVRPVQHHECRRLGPVESW